MKNMTCRQLGGTCDFLLSGQTAQDIMTKGEKHIRDLSTNGDESHQKILRMMEDMQKNPQQMKKWNATFDAKFINTPDTNE